METKDLLKEKLVALIESALQPVYIENAKDLDSGDISPLDENTLTEAIEDIANVLMRLREYNQN